MIATHCSWLRYMAIPFVFQAVALLAILTPATQLSIEPGGLMKSVCLSPEASLGLGKFVPEEFVAPCHRATS
ncbi:hypothetical protein FE392_08095 [Xenorhabdus sp. 12]|uniref:Uncharacterized protein n=1 Tax=Xenorhabdus santafensis TaxID=2582833 RepID=A0ABU4S943_9GAMM|nr:hypothetical protein [Xenorhabdus sp. 12]MDX7987291.1 hypothetical protein [Xenorhabdus sp. 12]